jgi:hypothetical protein
VIRAWLPALLGLLAACVTAVPAGAVVNGTPVDPASVPWFAGLGSCGGRLVAPDRVLTAGHCVYNKTPDEFPAISVGGVVRKATHVAMHPNWRHRNGTNFLDDVAVIQLDQPVVGVPAVVLGGIEPGLAHILGRGRPFAPGTGHSEAEMLDSTLRTADLKTIGDAQCARAFKRYKNPSRETFDLRMRCSIDADGLEPLYSGCYGDSGGPLWTGASDAPVQLGVVSWGGNSGADHRPSVFADVALYRDFITDPSPTWAPTKKGRAARISGAPRVGRTLTCSPPGYTPEPGAKLAYAWSTLGRFAHGRYTPPAALGHGRTYKLAKRDAGRRVACHVSATNAGGSVDVGVANVLIRRSR